MFDSNPNSLRSRFSDLMLVVVAAAHTTRRSSRRLGVPMGGEPLGSLARFLTQEQELTSWYVNQVSTASSKNLTCFGVIPHLKPTASLNCPRQPIMPYFYSKQNSKQAIVRFQNFESEIRVSRNKNQTADSLCFCNIN